MSVTSAQPGGAPQANGEDARSEKSEPTARRRLNILLTDDNEFNRRVGRMKLEKHNHAVTVVGSGQEALDALDKTAFDVVLMDVQMPDMDGLEATAAIRRKEEATGRHIPVIAMTAHAMKGDRERFLAAGMDGYVAKPVRDEELWAAIDSLTSQGEPVESAMTAEPAANAVPAETPASDAVFDREAVLARVGGNLELLQSLTHVFNKDCASLTGEIRAALDKHQLAEGAGRRTRSRASSASSAPPPRHVPAKSWKHSSNKVTKPAPAPRSLTSCPRLTPFSETWPSSPAPGRVLISLREMKEHLAERDEYLLVYADSLFGCLSKLSMMALACFSDTSACSS